MDSKKGYFLISFDTELAWGTLDHQGWKKYGRHYEMVRQIVSQLLTLLEKYELSATWDIVGRLFLSKERLNDGFEGLNDPDINSSLLYAPDIVRNILNCPVKQEIGSHTFGHMVASEVSKERFERDLEDWKKAASPYGIKPVALVFPRNRAKHFDIVKKVGFRCYRGLDPTLSNRFPSPISRLVRGVESFLVLPPPVVWPTYKERLWNIPGSYYYLHKDGWAKFLPIKARVIRARKGLRRAEKERAIFHLWTHPFNLAGDVDGLLGGLDKIFQYAHELRMENVRMGQLCEILEGRRNE